MALDGSEWSDSCRGRFTPGVRVHSAHLAGDWVGPRTGLDAVAKKNPIISPAQNWTPVVQPGA